ncbi:MAG: transglycosylase domain-containing protein [Aggregatilineales bacterium]
MSNAPSNPSSNPPGAASNKGSSGGGWYVPPGAVSIPGDPATPASSGGSAPLPANPSPTYTGGWYAPPGARSPAPAEATPAEPGTTAAQPPLAPTPDSGNTPPVANVSGSDLPGAGLSNQANYDNYVPGVGFVATGANPPNAATPPAPVPPTPQSPPPSLAQPPVSAVPTPALTPVPPAPAPSASAGPAQTATPRLVVALPPADEPLEQQFNDVEQTVHVLRRRYTAGLLSPDQLRAELRKLMILDNAGQWWMIGMETDRWYRYDGRDWTLDSPPGRAPAAPSPALRPAGGLSAAPLTPTVPLPQGTSATMTAPLPANAPPSIPLDEFGMPLSPSQVQSAVAAQTLPLSVPVSDPGATVVGAATPYLDNTMRANSTVPVTVPSPIPYQNAVDTYAPADAAAVPAAVPYSFQPDYGERPRGIVANRHRFARAVALVAGILFFLALGITLVVIVGAVLGYYQIVNKYDAAIAALPTKANNTFKTVNILDAAGNVIAQVNDPNGGRRTLVPLAQISPYLIHATVSTEDSRFYQNPGFDVFAIARAVLQNVVAGQTVSGASTIEQQLARLLVFDPNSVGSPTQRKLIEIIVASEIDRRYTKDQILEMYLNQIPYGNFSYGIEAASQTYFNAHAKDLNLMQAALLAGLPQSPATYDPVQNRQAAFTRLDTVLRLMVNTGCLPVTNPATGQQPLCVTQNDINKAAAQKAIIETTTYQPPSNNYKHPHFVNYVLQQLEKTYGSAIYNAGFTVYTTLDPTLQAVAEKSVAAQVSQLAAQHVTDGAALVIRPQDGAVLAMVGSADFNNASIHGQINMALAPRQPGSSLKPFVYLTAFEPTSDGQYMTPATVLWDVPNSCFNVTNPPYCPTNYDNRFHGPVSVRTALANSYNVPAVKTFNYDTVDRFKIVADNVGLKFPLTQPDTAGLATALGATEVRLTDEVRAYATLANQGRQLGGLFAIARITTNDASGAQTEVYNASQNPITLSQVADPGLVYLITSILSDNNARVAAFGPNSSLQLANGQPAAVKTGTTSDFRDNWTVGYTPSVVVGVWVGNADDTPMINVEGVTGAGPIWNQVMTAAMAGKGIQPFAVPPNVGSTTVCADFGTAFFQGCKTQGQEVFVTNQPPPTVDKVIQQAQVDQWSGLIANQYCPNYTTTKTFFSLTDQSAIAWLNTNATGQNWAQTRGLTLPITPPPTAQCDQNTPEPVVNITSPQPSQTVSGLIQILGNMSVPNFAYYQLELAQAQNPTAVAQIGDLIRTQPSQPNAFLGGWETHNVPDGQYYLQVHFFDTQGHQATSTKIPVIVNNTNPPPPQLQQPGVPTAIGASPGGFPTLPPVNANPPTSPPFGVPTYRPLFPTASR